MLLLGLLRFIELALLIAFALEALFTFACEFRGLCGVVGCDGVWCGRGICIG